MPTLEELLAEDGFKRKTNRLKPLRGEGSSTSIAASFPNLTHGFSGSKPRPERTRSDLNPRRFLPMTPDEGELTEPRSGKALANRFSSVNFYREQLPEVQVKKSKVFRYSKDLMESEGSPSKNRRHLFSTEEAELNCKSRRFTGLKDGYSEHLLRKLYEEQKGKRIQNSLKPRFKHVRDRYPLPVLDETTLKSAIVMINSCIIDLIEDEVFRSSVNQSCISSLNSGGMKDAHPGGEDVIFILKEAIGAVEKIISEGFTKLELKKTSLKLSVITGLKSMKSDDRYFCGISPSHIAACAHLYLSILFKIQKKDTVSAKHLLQLFFHSPYQARTALLPGLWESLFLPHLSHLKAWHDREVESLQGTSGVKRKLEFLKKLYDDLLDMGTCKFAAFYKGWLMEDYKSPALPSALIPFASFPELSEDDDEIGSAKSPSSSYSVPYKAMISKIPYESVWKQRVGGFKRLIEWKLGRKRGSQYDSKNARLKNTQ